MASLKTGCSTSPMRFDSGLSPTASQLEPGMVMPIPGAQKPVVESVEEVLYSAYSDSHPNEKGNQPSRTQTMIDGSPTAPRWLQRQRSNLLSRRASSVQSSHQARALV
jgi:hypothetical protein